MVSAVITQLESPFVKASPETLEPNVLSNSPSLCLVVEMNEKILECRSVCGQFRM